MSEKNTGGKFPDDLPQENSAFYSVIVPCLFFFFLVLKQPFFYELMVIIGVGDFRISC